MPRTNFYCNFLVTQLSVSDGWLLQFSYQIESINNNWLFADEIHSPKSFWQLQQSSSDQKKYDWPFYEEYENLNFSSNIISTCLLFIQELAWTKQKHFHFGFSITLLNKHWYSIEQVGCREYHVILLLLLKNTAA